MWRHNIISWGHDNGNSLWFSLPKFWIFENRPVDHIHVLQTPIKLSICNVHLRILEQGSPFCASWKKKLQLQYLTTSGVVHISFLRLSVRFYWHLNTTYCIINVKRAQIILTTRDYKGPYYGHCQYLLWQDPWWDNTSVYCFLSAMSNIWQHIVWNYTNISFINHLILDTTDVVSIIVNMFILSLNSTFVIFNLVIPNLNFCLPSLILKFV